MKTLSDYCEMTRGQLGKQRLLLRQAKAILDQNQCGSALFEALSGVVCMQIDQSIAMDALLQIEQDRALAAEQLEEWQ